MQQSQKTKPSSSRYVRSIRLSAFQNTVLDQLEYPGVLIRLLLDEYFEGRLQHLKVKYEQEVDNVKKEKRKNGERAARTGKW